MGHRGEDASRSQADWGGRPPWEGEDSARPGRPEHDQYDDYGRPSGGYGDPAGYGEPAGWGDPAGYGQRPDAAYHQPWGTGGGYQDPEPGYGQPAGYPDGPREDGYQDRDAGNDWYGGQPAAASGASFADTGAHRFSGRIADEYGTGPAQSLRDPGRGYPPAADPFASGPTAAPRTGPQSVPYTGQQERHDDYGGYDGGRGYGGYGGYGDEAAYSAAPAGGQRDGYDDAREDDPYGDRGNGGGEPARTGKGGRGGRNPATAGSAGQRGPGRARGRRPLLLAAGAVAAVLVIGVAAYALLVRPRPAASSHPSAGPLPTAGSAPSAQACVKQFGTYCHIEASTDDPAPLTISELFPPAFTNDTDKNSFSLVSTKLDKKCSGAVIGSALISALKAGKCTQVVRASYVSGNGKIMGTIGVVNLATTNEAHRAGKVVGQSDFIAPLAAAKGVAKKLGQGTGVVEAEFKGHYLILTWSEFTNGSTPSTKAQDSELEHFSSDLVAGTANIPLSQRMVTGSPASSGNASP